MPHDDTSIRRPRRPPAPAGRRGVGCALVRAPSGSRVVSSVGEVVRTGGPSRGAGPVSEDSRAPTSPSAESTTAGSRSASTTPAAKTTKANRSDHSGPASLSSRPPIGVATATATTPPSITRELAVTSESALGSTRGVAAARVTW